MMEKIRLTEVEEYILELIEKDKDFFITNSIKNLAIKYNASEATISRLVKKMGYSKIKDMQIDFNKKSNIEYMTRVDKEYMIELADKSKSIVIMSALTIQPILDTAKIIESDILEDIANKIINNAKIMLFGIGNSNYSLEYFHNMLKRVGIRSSLNSSVGGFLTESTFLKEEGLLIILSNSLKTKEVQYILQNTPSHIDILLIKNINSEYKSDRENLYIVNYAHNENEKYMFPVFSSTSSQIFVLNILFNSILSKMDGYLNKLKEADRIIDDWNIEKNIVE